MGWIDGIYGAVTGMSMDSMMGVGSAVIAFFSALFSWRTMRKQDKRSAISLRLAHDNDIIRWSDQAIVHLAEAQEMLCEKGVSYPDADFRQRRSNCRAQLSAIIDRGRLFFPNVDRGDAHGVGNEAGYQGYRQRVLDALVKAYDLLGSAGAQMGPDTTSADKIKDIRRAFVAEIFKTVDPQRRGSQVKELSK
jgi:hypothetical protein